MMKVSLADGAATSETTVALKGRSNDGPCDNEKETFRLCSNLHYKLKARLRREEG